MYGIDDGLFVGVLFSIVVTRTVRCKVNLNGSWALILEKVLELKRRHEPFCANLVVVPRCKIGVQLFVDEIQEDVLKYPPVAAEQGFVDSTLGHVGDQIDKVDEALAVDEAPKGLDALVLPRRANQKAPSVSSTRRNHQVCHTCILAATVAPNSRGQKKLSIGQHGGSLENVEYSWRTVVVGSLDVDALTRSAIDTTVNDNARFLVQLVPSVHVPKQVGSKYVVLHAQIGWSCFS